MAEATTVKPSDNEEAVALVEDASTDLELVAELIADDDPVAAAQVLESAIAELKLVQEFLEEQDG